MGIATRSLAIIQSNVRRAKTRKPENGATVLGSFTLNVMVGNEPVCGVMYPRAGNYSLNFRRIIYAQFSRG